LVVHSVDGDNYVYYNNAGGWNADQTSQWKNISPASPDSGPAVRVSGAGGLQGIFYDGLGEIGKHVNSAFSTISGGSGTTTALVQNDIAKLTITGSTIRAFRNGVETTNSPWTLTGGPTAGSAGLFSFGSTSSSEAWDDFTGTGEVQGVLTNPTPMRRLRRARPRDGIGLQGSLDIKRWF
jgi:hypothetical protein